MPAEPAVKQGKPSGNARPSFSSIDLFRGLAAFAVVYNHCFNLMLDQSIVGCSVIWHTLALTASFGREAVISFFVVSGFWIGRSVDTSFAKGRWNGPDYLVARLSRLLIVLIPAMIIGGSLDALGRYALHLPSYMAFHPDGSDAFDVKTHLRPIDAIGNIFFLQDLAVRTWGTNGPLWTLACEAWYYMWYAVIVTAIRRKWSLPLLVSAIVCLIVSLLSFKVTILFGCWLMGVAAHRIDDRLVRRSPIGRYWMIGAALLALGLVAVARSHYMPYLPGCYAIGLGFTIMLLVALRSEFAPPRFAARLTVYGADASFSLYAIHLPILIFCIAVFMRGGRLPGSLVSLLVIGAMVVFLGACAWLFSRATERNTGWLRQKMTLTINRAGWGRHPARSPL